MIKKKPQQQQIIFFRCLYFKLVCSTNHIMPALGLFLYSLSLDSGLQVCPKGRLSVAHKPEKVAMCLNKNAQATIKRRKKNSGLTCILVNTALVIPGSPPTLDARPEA